MNVSAYIIRRGHRARTQAGRGRIRSRRRDRLAARFAATDRQLHGLPEISLPRSFVLHESQVMEAVAPSRLASHTARPGVIPRPFLARMALLLAAGQPHPAQRSRGALVLLLVHRQRRLAGRPLLQAQPAGPCRRRRADPVCSTHAAKLKWQKPHRQRASTSRRRRYGRRCLSSGPQKKPQKKPRP